jgi:non-canonical purine NTP pyrophosphatase (RdgB/HAM1 family)
MNKLYFATGNKGKAEEAKKILDVPIEISQLDLEEIQSMDLEEIAGHKLIQAYQKVKNPVFVDDVALYLDVWDGFPGPFVKYIHDGSNARLLYMLRNEKVRTGTLIATIGYYDGSKKHFFTGKLKVSIADKEQGESGWGLDPVLIPEGKDKTFAQMNEEEKNSDSHRSRALAEFKKFLDSQTDSNEL